MKPLFTRLSDDSLLGRCLRGLTQNQNEAANQVLWTKCPKTKFCGRVKLQLALCETVTHFNSGAGARAVLLKAYGVAPGTNMLSALRKSDDKRIKFAARKISAKAWLNRRKLRGKTKSKTKVKTTYMLGGFGLSKEPEDKTGVSNSKRKRKLSLKPKKKLNVVESQNDVDFMINTDEITFISDNMIPNFILAFKNKIVF